MSWVTWLGVAVVVYVAIGMLVTTAGEWVAGKPSAPIVRLMTVLFWLPCMVILLTNPRLRSRLRDRRG